MAKSAQDQTLTINKARVGDEDHIRQLFHRLDNFDFCPSSPEVGHKVVPLFNSKLEIRTIFSMHPGIEQWHNLVADRKSTRLNSSHVSISYAVFCLKKKKNIK